MNKTSCTYSRRFNTKNCRDFQCSGSGTVSWGGGMGMGMANQLIPKMICLLNIPWEQWGGGLRLGYVLGLAPSMLGGKSGPTWPWPKPP